MRIKIIFGMELDGVRWSREAASVGSIVCGPHKLIEILETHFGLTAASIDAPERINQYKAKIEAADCEWCRASFKLDPWGTTKHLMSLRDQLVEFGWNSSIGGSRRFDALGKIEETDLPLAPEFGDRVAAVMSSANTIAADLEIVDDVADYPPVWQKLIKRFFPNYSVRQTNNCKREPKAILLKAPNEIMLAHDFARYLVAGKSDNSRITIIAGGDTTLLDGVMNRAGLPMIGGSLPSAARESFQILPLWIENMWKPFSPEKFIQLLGITGSPVPGYIRHELVNALSEAPGIGGDRWEEAWRSIANKADEANDPEKAHRRAKELKALFEGERFDPEMQGIPIKELAKRLDMLSEYIRPRVVDAEEWKLVISHIKEFKRLIADEESIRRVDANRIIDNIYGSGIPRSGAVEQVADWTRVSSPGQILDDADTVLWWNFTSQDAHPVYWSPAERDAMAAAGLSLDEESGLARELKSWKNASAHAIKQLICFMPQNEDAMHPYGVNLGFADKDKIKHDRELFDFETGIWELEDRQVQLVQRSCYKQRLYDRAAALPENHIKPDQLSVTQLSSLISCPFRWILERYVKLRNAEIAQLPADNVSMGRLAHHIVEILSSRDEEENRHADRLPMRVGELFDSLLEKDYANLLLPENADRRIYARERLVRAVTMLFGEIERQGLVIEQAERPLSSEFDGVEFNGSADLVLRDSTDQWVVYDFKWSKSNKYEDTVKHGLSIQLAFYAWLLSPENFGVGSAYYLMPKYEFVHNVQNNRETFKRAVDFYRHRLEDINRGRVDWGETSDAYPEISDEDLEGCQNEDEVKARINELMPLRLPNAYRPECAYCTCKELCGRAMPIPTKD